MTSKSKPMNFEELWEYQQGALFLKKDLIYSMRKDLAEYFYKAGQEQLQKSYDKAIEDNKKLIEAFSKLIKTVPYNTVEPDYLKEARQTLK